MSLMRRAHLAFLTKLAAAAITYGFMLMVARMLEPAQFGQVAFFLNAAFLGAVLGAAGQQIALLRFVPGLRLCGDSAALAATLRVAIKRAFICTIACAGLALFTAFGLRQLGGLNGFTTPVILFGCALILAIGWIDFVAHLARAMDRTQLSLIPKEILWRLGGAALLACAISANIAPPSAELVLAILVAVLVFLAVLTQRKLRADLPVFDRTTPPPQAWAKTRNPFWVTSVSNVFLANADVVAIGLMFGALETGGYFLANRLAVLLAFFAVSHNVVLGPAIARHWAAGSPSIVARISARAAWQMTLPTLAVGVILIVSGGPILALFDPSFASATPILAALVVAAILNATTGPSDIVLNLCGHERPAMRIAVVNICAATVLIVVLGQAYGPLGVAYAVVIATCLRKALFALALWRALGIRTDVLAPITPAPALKAARL